MPTRTRTAIACAAAAARRFTGQNRATAVAPRRARWKAITIAAQVAVTLSVALAVTLTATACGSGSGSRPDPVPSTPPPTTPVPPPPTTPAPSTTGVALFPDGTPAANFQLIFVYGDYGGDYTDLTTDANGNFQVPDFSTCAFDCEIWLYVPATNANQTLFNQQTNYQEYNCELPLAASPNAQSWQDTQLSSQSPTTLYVVSTDCEEDSSLPGAIDNFHASLALSQAGNWVNTNGIEQMMNQGLLDESQAYSGS